MAKIRICSVAALFRQLLALLTLIGLAPLALAQTPTGPMPVPGDLVTTQVR